MTVNTEEQLGLQTAREKDAVVSNPMIMIEAKTLNRLPVPTRDMDKEVTSARSANLGYLLAQQSRCHKNLSTGFGFPTSLFLTIGKILD